MPLSYPFSLSDFQEILVINKRGFFINNPMEVSKTAGGSVLKASLGSSLWKGNFSLEFTTDMSKAGKINALISILDRPSSSFMVYDPAKPYPAYDPTGSIISGASPTVRLLDSGDSRLIALAALPSTYKLLAGDYIAWQYTVSGQTRYALHQIVSDSTADSSGDTSLFEVTPFIQPGVVIGDSVSLVKPSMKAVLDIDPSYPTVESIVSSGGSFSFVQSVR
jgi:hypothetical protein